jgi:hypothetical protein
MNIYTGEIHIRTLLKSICLLAGVIVSVASLVASRSITLLNELPGTVKAVDLKPGRIVEAAS